jgi:hypothetical protein
MGFTFYGDLLGVSNLYRLNPESAHNSLNTFYNTIYYAFERLLANRHDVKGNLFSDSLVIYGDDPTKEILEILQQIYLQLIQQNLLLRGAIVKGKLQYEPRYELQTLSKRLPLDDTLARAVSLERTKKGSRLLIEVQLAEELFRLNNCSNWATIEGYNQNPKPEIPLDGIMRRISPDPNLGIYELLYFWAPEYHSDFVNDFNCDEIKKRLKSISGMLSDDISIHYKETLKLLDRASLRKQLTEYHFEANT